MALRPIPLISTAVMADRLNHFLTNLFVTYRLDTLYLPANWLSQQLGVAGQDRAEAGELREYLRECGLEPAYLPTPNRIPVGWEQDNKTVLYLDESIGRPYIFKAADWLSEEQLAEYTPAFQAAA